MARGMVAVMAMAMAACGGAVEEEGAGEAPGSARTNITGAYTLAATGGGTCGRYTLQSDMAVTDNGGLRIEHPWLVDGCPGALDGSRLEAACAIVDSSGAEVIRLHWQLDTAPNALTGALSIELTGAHPWGACLESLAIVATRR